MVFTSLTSRDKILEARVRKTGTENKDHFERLPNLKGKVMTPKEFCQEFDQV
jgi:hypothetical protein